MTILYRYCSVFHSMKTKNQAVFVAVTLFGSPIENKQNTSVLALIAVNTNPKKVIDIVRSIEDGSMAFNTESYTAIYKTSLDADLRNYKLHRIGDDHLSESSPIVLMRYWVPETQEWTEEWFDDYLEKQFKQ